MRFADRIAYVADETNVLLSRKRARQFLGIGFGDKYLAAFPSRDGFGDLHRRTFAKIVDVGLERKTEQRDLGFGAGSSCAGDRSLDFFKHEGRLAVVHFARGANET